MSIVERTRLAQELHDGIAQDLVAVGYALDLLLAAPATPIETRIHLRTLRFSITELINKVRIEVHHLHQPESVDLKTRIREMAEQTCQGLELAFSMEDISLPLGEDLEYHIGRIAQEVLRNIASHSQASSVHISLTEKEGGLQLEISDDGVGGLAATSGHYGIQSIQSRTESIGGVVNFYSLASGTKMNLAVPIC